MQMLMAFPGVTGHRNIDQLPSSYSTLEKFKNYSSNHKSYIKVSMSIFKGKYCEFQKKGVFLFFFIGPNIYIISHSKK